jgi:site-specific recombinase XerD
MRNNVNPRRMREAREKIKMPAKSMGKWPLLKVVADAMAPIETYSRSTISNYRHACRQFQKYVGYEQSPVNVTEAKLKKFGEWLAAEGMSAKTVRLQVDGLAAVVRFADASLLPSRQVAERRPFADADVAGTIEHFMVYEYFPVSPKLNSDETRRQYGMAAARFSRYLERPAVLADLKDETVAAWLKALHSSGIRFSTVKTYGAYIRAFWNWAMQRGIMATAPRFLDLVGKDGLKKKKPTKPAAVVRKRGGQPLPPDPPELLVPNGILTFVKRFAESRDVSDKYVYRLRLTSRQLATFAGKFSIEDLFSEEVVTSFLKSRDKLSPFSVRSIRADIVAMWNFAADLDLVAYPRLRRLYRPRCPELLIECYMVDEVRALLTAAGRQHGEYSNGVSKKVYWSAAIRLAWDTGLRRGDIWDFQKSRLEPDGSMRVVQHKTKRIVRIKLRQSTLQALNEIHYDKALQWPMEINYFTRHFKKIIRESGVNKGSFKWLRRSSGSYVEMERVGAGAKHLGHTSPLVFERHYDAKLGEHLLPMPPELAD